MPIPGIGGSTSSCGYSQRGHSGGLFRHHSDHAGSQPSRNETTDIHVEFADSCRQSQIKRRLD
jgi:hypothetical protein